MDNNNEIMLEDAARIIRLDASNASFEMKNGFLTLTMTENGEEKNTENCGSAAFDRTGNPDERERKGSDRQHTVKHNVRHVGTNQREHEKQITKRNQRTEGKRRPDQNKVDRGALQQIGNQTEKDHNAHKICARVSDIGFQNRSKFFHIFLFFLYYFSKKVCETPSARRHTERSPAKIPLALLVLWA